MKRILSLVLLGMAAISFSQTTGVTGKAANQNEQDATATWRSSYARFEQELVAYTGEKPATTLDSYLNGQAVLRSWKIMQLYAPELP